MNNKNILNLTSKITSYLFFAFLLIMMLFTRSFVGLQYKSYRLGEAIIFGCFLFAFIILIFFNKLNISQYIEKYLIY